MNNGVRILTLPVRNLCNVCLLCCIAVQLSNVEELSADEGNVTCRS